MRFEIAPRSIALLLATIVAVWLAWELRTVELILVVALILAGTFNPLIEWMESKRLSRPVALTILFATLLLGFVGFLVLTVPPLSQQVMTIVQDAPATRTRIIAFLVEHRAPAPLVNAVRSAELQQGIAHIEQSALGYSSRAMMMIGYAATTIVLAFYLLADRTRARGVLYAVVPRGYHLRLARILQNMETIVGGYMRGQMITCAAIGVFTWVLLLVCRVPNALSLALFAAIVDVIPFIGGLMVIIPAVVSALPNGVPIALTILAALLIYMEFENRLLVPRVYGKVLRLPSTAVVLALIAGGTLMGMLGALLALPITASVLMMIDELRIELPGDDSVDDKSRALDAKAEAVYEKMSAGATAPEASEIAKTLAQDLSAAQDAAAPKT